MAEWTADWANNPDDDYALIVEVMDGNQSCARIERGKDGELVFTTYPTGQATAYL